MSSLAERRKARREYLASVKASKPGEGKRFAALKKAAKTSGAENPGAVAAAIGRKKYGKKKFQAMAAVGKKK
jgi:hypothetical protein